MGQSPRKCFSSSLGMLLSINSSRNLNVCSKKGVTDYFLSLKCLCTVQPWRAVYLAVSQCFALQHDDVSVHTAIS